MSSKLLLMTGRFLVCHAIFFLGFMCIQGGNHKSSLDVRKKYLSRLEGDNSWVAVAVSFPFSVILERGEHCRSQMTFIVTNHQWTMLRSVNDEALNNKSDIWSSTPWPLLFIVSWNTGWIFSDFPVIVDLLQSCFFQLGSIFTSY